jgi:methionyl-tRNA formyltransferase
MKIVFFGGDPLGPITLKTLTERDLKPSLVVANPDRPVGRQQIMTAPPTKLIAEELSIEVFQPQDYQNPADFSILLDQDWDLFVVVAYNFILPKWLLDIPKQGTLNLHPSLLPRLRGASPIRTAIKDNLIDDVGVTVMLMDEKMDHGPILDQVFIDLPTWPMLGPDLDMLLAETGSNLLANTIPLWVSGELYPQTQDHSNATYSHRLTKNDSELKLDPLNLPTDHEARSVWHKICAFAGIGETFFIYQNQRVKITKADLEDGKNLRIKRVIPAGKVEMDFEDYLKRLKK